MAFTTAPTASSQSAPQDAAAAPPRKESKPRKARKTGRKRPVAMQHQGLQAPVEELHIIDLPQDQLLPLAPYYFYDENAPCRPGRRPPSSAHPQRAGGPNKWPSRPRNAPSWPQMWRFLTDFHGLLDVEAVSFNQFSHAPYPGQQDEVDVHGDDLFQPGLWSESFLQKSHHVVELVHLLTPRLRRSIIYYIDY